VDCRQHALIPGLVNAHTHAAMSLFRGLADDLPLMTWLQQHIWPAEARFGDRQFVREGTRLAAYEMLRGGTTCFNDMYFFPDEAAATATEVGIRAVIGMIVIGFPTAWAQDTREYLRLGQQVHDRYRAHPLIHTAFAPHAPYTVDDAALTQIAMLAEELDVPIHMHVHETRQEIEDSVQLHGVRPLARLQRLGLLSPRLLAVHMTQLEPTEIEMIAKAGVNIAHCPESNLKLASGMCSRQGSIARLALTARRAITISICSPRCAALDCWRKQSRPILVCCRPARRYGLPP
jgi:5-methylthioadenosine/S-adenosylhomocysteine deaminase